MMPAPSRRPRIPTTFSTATDRIAAAASPSAPLRTSPESNAGTITRPAIAPSTNALPTVISPNSALPIALSAKIRGSSRTEIQRIPSPRRTTSVRTFSVRTFCLRAPSPRTTQIPLVALLTRRPPSCAGRT